MKAAGSPTKEALLLGVQLEQAAKDGTLGLVQALLDGHNVSVLCISTALPGTSETGIRPIALILCDEQSELIASKLMIGGVSTTYVPPQPSRGVVTVSPRSSRGAVPGRRPRRG